MPHPPQDDDGMTHSSSFSIPGRDDELTPIEEEALRKLVMLLGGMEGLE